MPAIGGLEQLFIRRAEPDVRVHPAPGDASDNAVADAPRTLPCQFVTQRTAETHLGHVYPKTRALLA
jgi:hypothetical protein